MENQKLTVSTLMFNKDSHSEIELPTKQDVTEIVNLMELNDVAELKSFLYGASKLTNIDVLEFSYGVDFIKNFLISDLINVISNTMEVMTLSEYLALCGSTLSDLGTPLQNEMHMALGMVTEAGEFADAYKKHFAYGKPLDVANCSEEGGDMMWYIGNWYRLTELDIHKALYTNIAKLKARYPKGFTQDKAENRDLSKERVILENGLKA